MDELNQDGRLIELQLAKIDKHIAALEAEALEAKSLEPAKAPQPARENEVVEGVTCKYNDRTIYSNAPGK